MPRWGPGGSRPGGAGEAQAHGALDEDRDEGPDAGPGQSVPGVGHRAAHRVRGHPVLVVPGDEALLGLAADGVVVDRGAEHDQRSTT